MPGRPRVRRLHYRVRGVQRRTILQRGVPGCDTAGRTHHSAPGAPQHRRGCKDLGTGLGVHCDNMNACLAVRSGKSRDGYMQSCVQELFLLCSINDIELHVTHRPGTDMKRADALSRAHTGQVFRDRIKANIALNRARQVRIPTGAFDITNVM